jgi:hypothetical protein
VPAAHDDADRGHLSGVILLQGLLQTQHHAVDGCGAELAQAVGQIAGRRPFHGQGLQSVVQLDLAGHTGSAVVLRVDRQLGRHALGHFAR